VLAVFVTAACGGADLGKQNFPRTTVPASAQAGDAPVTDAAVALDKLRTVDPCGLIGGSTLADLGTVEDAPSSHSEVDSCTAVLHDAGGKRLQIDLTLGELMIGTEDVTGTVGGLPMAQNKLNNSSCDVTAITSRSPGLGIGVSASYQGGDACSAGQTALEKVLQKLHGNPPQLPQPAGSAIAVDLCAVPDDALMTEVLGRGTEKGPAALHRCAWNGGAANGYLTLSETLVPDNTDGEPRVLQPRNVVVYQALRNGAGKQCTLTWLQRATQDGEGEVLSFEYDNFHDDAGNDDACAKAHRVVEAILPKLPST
jgi:hypothetical protein